MFSKTHSTKARAQARLPDRASPSKVPKDPKVKLQTLGIVSDNTSSWWGSLGMFCYSVAIVRIQHGGGHLEKGWHWKPLHGGRDHSSDVKYELLKKV